MGANQNFLRELDQDRIIIEKLSALRAGLGIAMKTRTMLARTRARLEIKIRSKISSISLRHFTKHLTGRLVNHRVRAIETKKT
jgi:hypothetical protein